MIESYVEVIQAVEFIDKAGNPSWFRLGQKGVKKIIRLEPHGFSVITDDMIFEIYQPTFSEIKKENRSVS